MRVSLCDICLNRGECYDDTMCVDACSAFARDDSILRNATEEEVESGKANWCAACENDCPFAGADLLFMCKNWVGDK